MVDSVNNHTGTNSLLRAQQAAQASQVHGVKPQTVINQSRSAAVVPVKASAVPQPQSIKLAGTPDKILPRGSLVDQLV